MEEGYSADPMPHFPNPKALKIALIPSSPFLSSLSNFFCSPSTLWIVLVSQLLIPSLIWCGFIGTWEWPCEQFSHNTEVIELSSEKEISGIHILQRKEYLKFTVDSVVFAFCSWTYCFFNKLTYIQKSSGACILHAACILCILMCFIWSIFHIKLLTMHLVLIDKL